MRTERDLMERLAAADPAPDAERLTPEEEREAEALLARVLATPAGRGAARRARPRRLALAAAGVACAAAVGFTALDLIDSDGPGPGVVERAVAAVTQEDSVYHVVQIKRGTGDDVPGPFLFESWHSSDGRVHEKIFAVRDGRRGRLLEEVAGRRRAGRSSGPLLRYDPRENILYPSGFGSAPGADELPLLEPHGDPGATLRRLEERGLLRLAGSTTVDGRRAYRLVSGPIRRTEGEEERFEWVVDAATYLPLVQRYTIRTVDGRRLGFVTRFRVYERLELDPQTEERLDLDPHPGATCAIGAGELKGDRGLGFPNPCPPAGERGPARSP